MSIRKHIQNINLESDTEELVEDNTLEDSTELVQDLANVKKEVEEATEATEEALKSNYALFSLLNPISVGNAISDVAERYIAGYEDILAIVDKLADGDKELTNKIKSELANNDGISPSSSYKYINDKLRAFVKSASRTDITEQAILIPRVGNSIAVYGDAFRSDSYVDYVNDYDVSDILSERGKAVADKYGTDEIFKTFNFLDSKASNVMKDLDKALSLTNNIRNACLNQQL